MKKLWIYLLLVVGTALSCETLPDPEVELSPVYPVSGEWWVTYKFDDGSGVIDDYSGAGYTRLLTFNTAANTTDSIWITDDENFWEFKVKAGLNMDSKSFSVAEGTELLHDDATTIQNGKVVELADGDSIYMEIEWASDPGIIYYCSGRRVKGFLDGSGSTSYEADYGD